jgi:hypothetical protein
MMANGTFGGRPGGAMTDEEMTAYLRENGYPEHVVRAGRTGLIERWRKFVEEVESGYKLGLEDYRNDLDIRGILRMLGLDTELEDLDRRLESALTDRTQRVWESAPGDPFWDFGYPRSAGRDLLEDLKKEGLST